MVAADVEKIRACYGPDEHQAVELYGDVIDAFETAGLPAYVETRGGLAVCATVSDGSLLIVASDDALPWNRDALTGWHLSHTAEDEPGTPWRCTVYDTVSTGHYHSATLNVAPMVSAGMAHLGACSKAAAL
ncbi:hypothetical protein ACX9I7_01185 [Streptomyces sp. L500]